MNGDRAFGLALDVVAAATPFLPAVAGATARAARAADGARLPDHALVCRGGTCTAGRFEGGKGVTTDGSGKLNGVSVNSAPGKSVKDLTTSIPNGQVGVTTVGGVRRAGGDVTRSPTASNPDHCTMCGLTAEQAEKMFTPTVPNPNR